MKKHSPLIRRMYREKDYERIHDKITLLGNDTKMDTLTFMNTRMLSSILVFLFALYIFRLGYVFAPFLAVVWYYLFYYSFIILPLKRRVLKLDHEALYFFEILTLTLESGRNLESSLEITCFNINSEISEEFKRTLFEMKFGKSLIEALEDMKKRIPSEAVNNI